MRRVVNLRQWICHLLSVLRIHSPDCEHCEPGRRYRGKDMRKRLEELLEPHLVYIAHRRRDCSADRECEAAPYASASYCILSSIRSPVMSAFVTLSVTRLAHQAHR
jgi:hypothetical protein